MITILDGYTDEPACLGVPPYIAPLPRYIYGAIRSLDLDAAYLTIDELRNASSKSNVLKKSDLLVIVAGAIVPGRYIRGMPISAKETLDIGQNFKGKSIIGGAAARYGFLGSVGRGLPSRSEVLEPFEHVCTGDLDAFVFDYLSGQSPVDRKRTTDELEKWAISGAQATRHHPDHPRPLIAEIETYSGCVRYFNGGCSFCIEPESGEPQFRKPEDVAAEISSLNKNGVVNFRLGGQSCIYSYMSRGIGETETPKPDPEALRRLIVGARSAAPNLEVLHLDNANPAVIAENPKESEEITKIICELCTSGNAVAFGLESADPVVANQNNLNATTEQTLLAVELVNKYGASRGTNGMPLFLPGINFISGLKGETKSTFTKNLDFLTDILDRKLLLRRINIRQVFQKGASLEKSDDICLNHGEDGFISKKHYSSFLNFKKIVREKIDGPMLRRLVPEGTILKNAYIEGKFEGMTWARQTGTYPLLIGIPYDIHPGVFRDIRVTGHGFRSITGIEQPFPINLATLKALESLPGVGKKRATRLKLKSPIKNEDELRNALDDQDVAKALASFVCFDTH